jgi:3-phosphoshikimate 1-carboxyvinyltransferase
MPPTDKKTPKRRQAPSQELVELDRRLTSLLVRRAEILSETSSKRRARGGKIADPAQEKALWAVWKERRDESGVDGRIWEQLFNLSNGLAYARAEVQRQHPAGYVLSPRRSPVSIDLPGPRDLIASRLALAMAVVSGRPLSLPSVVLNDPMIELIKAFNQAGGAVSWDAAGVRAGQSDGLALDGKVVYAGNDPLNLFLLLVLSLQTTGTFKITGGSGLKTMDLSPLQPVLTQLGARIVHLDPHSLGAPLRVEASGVAPSEIRLPTSCPRDFVRALVVTTAAMGRSMRIHWESGRLGHSVEGKISFLLERFGCRHSTLEAGIEFHGNGLTIPPELAIPLDPVLSGFVLSFPSVAGGKARLAGKWPAWPEAAEVELLIKRYTTLYVGTDEIVANGPGGGSQEGQPTMGFSPLSAALVLLRGGGSQELTIDHGFEEPRLLSDFGVRYTTRDGTLRLGWAEQQAGPPPTLHAPTPEWAMALALLSFRLSGMTLLNPGIVSQAWPQFWQIFNGLPNPTLRVHAQDREEQDATKRRRRIIS